jgi:hypothetical protein
MSGWGIARFGKGRLWWISLKPTPIRPDHSVHPSAPVILLYQTFLLELAEITLIEICIAP